MVRIDSLNKKQKLREEQTLNGTKNLKYLKIRSIYVYLNIYGIIKENGRDKNIFW